MKKFFKKLFLTDENNIKNVISESQIEQERELMELASIEFYEKKL